MKKGTAFYISAVAAVLGAIGVALAAYSSMISIDNALAMQVVAVGFIIGVLQDSAETALNSSSDVLFTAAACLRAERIEQDRNRREQEINEKIRRS